MSTTPVSFAVATCALGKLVVAATDAGLFLVTMGDDEHALASTVIHAARGAPVVRDETRVQPYLDTLLAYLDGRVYTFDLPLERRGTPFQQQVWAALRDIPYGEVRTYAEVAHTIGRPTAARAVAGACGANPVALVVPCHRVIRTGGGLGGYGAGIARKQWLLDLEAQGVHRAEG